MFEEAVMVDTVTSTKNHLGRTCRHHEKPEDYYNSGKMLHFVKPFYVHEKLESSGISQIKNALGMPKQAYFYFVHWMYVFVLKCSQDWGANPDPLIFRLFPPFALPLSPRGFTTGCILIGSVG
jgi:hypothetical protein